MAYPDPINADGLPVTNGYGSTRNRDNQLWEIGDRITEDEALWLLHRDVSEAYCPCKNIPCWEEMNAHQRAALADLNYNEGYTWGDGNHDTLDNLLENKNWNIGIALQLYDNNDQLGLSRRRYTEWLMFKKAMEPKQAYLAAWAMNSVAEVMAAL